MCDSQFILSMRFYCLRISQRLHFLRRLRVFGIMKDIMLTFYKAAIESIITWFGNLSVKFKALLQSLQERESWEDNGYAPISL